MQWIELLNHNWLFCCSSSPTGRTGATIFVHVRARVQYMTTGKPSCRPGWLATEALPYSTAPETQVPNHWALISSYRHGACGHRLPGSQTPNSATVTAGSQTSEARAERNLLLHFVRNGQRFYFINVRAVHVASGAEAFSLSGSLGMVSHFTSQSTGFQARGKH